MSDNSPNVPFAAPQPGTPQPGMPQTGAPQWQGSPVPLPPTVTPPPAYIPPPPAYLPPSPAPGVAAYAPPPPAAYMYAPVYNAGQTANNWMGITSLILSLTTILFGVTCIPGVVLGHLGLSAAKKGTANNKGISLAGVIIGWVFIGFWLLFFALIAAVIAADSSGG